MKTINLIIQFIIIAAIFFGVLFFAQQNWRSLSEFWQYRQLFFSGWLVTIELSAASLLLSVIIGLCAALIKRSSLPVLSFLVKIYIELIRGTPLLVQILFFFYIVAYNIGLENRHIAGVIILSLFSGAYIAEMIRASLDAVSATKLEAAKALGMTPLQCYRFVVFPLAIRQVIPPLAGQFASIIKDSSLLSIIGINELTNCAQQINSATYNTIESFFPLALAYLALTLPISLWSKKLEDKYKYET